MKMYSNIYDKNFTLLETEVKLKDSQTPWMSKAIKKSSKQKQKLYIKLYKSKNPEDEVIYKNYKSLFEKLRKNSKQSSLFEPIGKTQRKYKTTKAGLKRNHRKSS